MEPPQLRRYKVSGVHWIEKEQTKEAGHHLVMQKHLKVGWHTGNFREKKSKFCSDMNPPPLHKIPITITGSRQFGELMSESTTSIPEHTNIYPWTRSAYGHDVITHLKSVEGSVPCQPISFHCSDTSPGKARPGNAERQRALRASCNEYK